MSKKVDDVYGKAEKTAYKGEGRRESDHRFHDIETKIDTLDGKVVEVYDKMTNGLATAVALTEQKVGLIEKQNADEHKFMMRGMSDLGKKLDKILFTLVGMTVLAFISIGIKKVLEVL